MVVGLLATLGILGVIALLVMAFVQRGRETLDFSLRGLLRVYLYLASLVGIVVFTLGIAGIAAFLLAAIFGRDVIYGGPPPQPVPAIAPACPPNTTCPPFVTFAPRPPVIPDERERRQQEDLVRGVTQLVFGGMFWGAHWAARKGIVGGDERASGLYRAYLILGTAVFGIATIVLLPTGIYQALSQVLITAQPGTFRQGAGESLSGGIATLPIWLLYLWLVQRALRTPAATTAVA
ncbi:MAG: hypothetical protein E6J38_03930 [Chloroflexi bacterium]|nr:MAG: hypothetical protein E6J38_03930 [Chloroflexota bacterium]